MKKYVALGAVIFLAIGILMAPAGLVDRAADNIEGVDLSQPRGTVWNGQAAVRIRDISLGTLDWRFKPLSLFLFEPAYNWSLHAVTHELQGTIAFDFEHTHIEVAGASEAAPLDSFLSRYDIATSGSFDVHPTRLKVDAQGMLLSADGQIDWSGGPVSYILGGVLYDRQLPPMTVYLDAGDSALPRGVLFEQGGSIPLAFANLAEGGRARVGITKRFTKLLGDPWPGSDADHAVVLEVEEQFF